MKLKVALSQEQQQSFIELWRQLSPWKLKSEMMQRIGVIIAAQSALTIARRAEARMRPGNSASKRASIEATLLEAEP